MSDPSASVQPNSEALSSLPHQNRVQGRRVKERNSGVEDSISWAAWYTAKNAGFCQTELGSNPPSFIAVNLSVPYHLRGKWGSVTLVKFLHLTETQFPPPQDGKEQMNWELWKKHLVNCKLLHTRVLEVRNLAKAICSRIRTWSPSLSGPKHVPVPITPWCLH